MALLIEITEDLKMASQIQKMNNKTRVICLDPASLRTTAIYEFDRKKQSRLRREFKKMNRESICKIEHGNWS